MRYYDGMYLLLRRSGARVDDLLCSTGALRSAGGGLWAWQQGRLDSPFITRLLEPGFSLFPVANRLEMEL